MDLDVWQDEASFAVPFWVVSYIPLPKKNMTNPKGTTKKESLGLFVWGPFNKRVLYFEVYEGDPEFCVLAILYYGLQGTR